MSLPKPTGVQANAEGISFKGPAEAWKYWVTVQNSDGSSAISRIFIPAPRNRTEFTFTWFDFDLLVTAPGNFKEGTLTLRMVAAMKDEMDDSEEVSVQFTLSAEEVVVINRAIRGPQNLVPTLAAVPTKPAMPKITNVLDGEWIEVDHRDRANVRYRVEVLCGNDLVFRGEVASLPNKPTRIVFAQLETVTTKPLTRIQHVVFITVLTLLPRGYVSDPLRRVVMFDRRRVRALNKELGLTSPIKLTPGKVLVFGLLLLTLGCIAWAGLNMDTKRVFARTDRGDSKVFTPTSLDNTLLPVETATNDTRPEPPPIEGQPDVPVPDGLTVLPQPLIVGTNIPFLEPTNQVTEVAAQPAVATNSVKLANVVTPVTPPAPTPTNQPVEVRVVQNVQIMQTGSPTVIGNNQVVGNIFNVPVQIQFQTTNIKR